MTTDQKSQKLWQYFTEFVEDIISKPRMLCSDVPYCLHGDKDCQECAASVYLKWEITREMVSKSVVFVISVRKIEFKDQAPSDWHMLQLVSRTEQE